MTLVSKIRLIGGAALVLLYRLTYYSNPVWAMIIGISIVLLVVGAIIHFAILNPKYRLMWLLSAAFITAYQAAHMVEVLTNAKVESLEIDISLALFSLANFFLLLSLIVYLKFSMKNWEKTQLKVDILKVSVVILYMYHGIFNSGAQVEDVISSYNTFVFIRDMYTVFSDTAIMWMLFILISSIRIKSLARKLMPMSASVATYILIELSAAYRHLGIFDVPAVALNVSFYILTILMLWSISMISDNREKLSAELKARTLPHNIGKTYAMIWLGLLTVILYSMQLMSLGSAVNVLMMILILELLDRTLQDSFVIKNTLVEEQISKEELSILAEERAHEIQNLSEDLYIESTIDHITGLQNRFQFLSQLEQMVKTKKPFSIIMMNISRFNAINDLYGHTTGDRVLENVGKNLKDLEKSKNSCARFGADEFVILLEDASEDRINAEKRRLLNVMSQKIIVDDLEFSLDVNMGTSVYPSDGKTALELIKHCHVALKYAKENSSDVNDFNSSFVYETLKRKNYIELELKNLNFDEHLELYYQAQVSSVSKVVSGMEALLRWKHPEKGFIPPDEFIPIAENIGVIHKITDWVFEQSMKQIKIWNEKYGKDLIVNVNISAKSFHSSTFIPKLKQLLLDNEINPKWYGIEITEHSSMSSSARVEEFFMAIWAMGIRISIDDFGTGYSSLNYLRRFSVDELKIDKELIDHITEEQTDMTIVRAIILMARGIGLDVVAEGVETKEQYEILRNMKCTTIQGYYFARPVPANEFEETFLAPHTL